MTELRVEPMAGDDLTTFLRSQKAEYIQQRVEFGGEDVEEATRIAERQHAEFFPDGRPAAGHHLFVGRDAGRGARIGILWLYLRIQGGSVVVWVYDIEVDESSRGLGWGRRLMGYAENWARDNGAGRIELNVFGGNAIARTLYSSLGYAESSVHMTKPLVQGS